MFKVSDIVEITKGELLRKSSANPEITDILVDSRRLISPENCVFVTLLGRNNNGHDYIPELYEKGIRTFIISVYNTKFDNYKDASFIKVKNTLIALQALAAAHRKKFDIPIIGITGSNGKTIIKEWLFQLLQKKYKIVRSPKSYNSQVGVPLSVWQMEASNDLAIFEAGISRPDEMDKLQAIIRPGVGIFTNIGDAHNENFISIMQKVGEKLKLFTKVDTLIYCSDHAAIQEVLIRSQMLETIQAFTWSRKQPADLQITSVLRTKLESTTITGIYQEEEISIEIPFVDEASLENAIHCWAALLHMGMDMDLIAEGMKMLQPIAMRLEMKAGINHCTVINDSYNSDINSLSIAIDFLNQQSQHKKRTIVLSDILQSGKDAEELYSDIAGILKQKNIGRIIGIGPAISRQADFFEMEKTFYSSTEEFMRKFSFTSISNETILLKGARIFEFEQISKALQQKSHETVMEINLNAMVNNLNYFRSKISPLTRIMAMVKAFSYGSGGYEIANLLQFHRVDYLTVAYADEGVELRKAGIILPIMVMNPEEHSFDAMIQHNLEPEIYNFRILDVLEKAIRKNILPRNKPVKIHIKLETGMHRLGFEATELERLSDRIRNNRRLYVQSVFSHLVASGEPESDEFTRGQIEKFKEMCDNFCGTIHHTVLRHMTNSAGITRFPEAHFDMVRLGVSLYGVASNSEDEGGLENVSTLKSTISQIKKVKAGERIGYGNMIIGNDMDIAVVPVGYADGLDRKLGNGTGHLIIGGQKASIVGSICMDMCMVDITEIKAREGDTVIIFGDDRPISELAADLKTIPYEVMTSISGRVKRVYFQE
ncbi:MAG: bifunctional UDP-N-acetylmuramoyl-tripeptide:D-alanyl-D-alanine ligase/alanine racemase [Bacteroidales bacterium]|nr:bifunctional UDP-N-acetylmuramoyl-tripeptide:D-alanyl-D-alanine ligase/alanine racemase [Bacteroidales bacterium]